jgi:hypothetical protein
MTAVVFAGPSIYGLEKDILAGIELRPPAACGDILRACRGDISRIGLVDGVFESSPSVWHKEILFALSRGVKLFGAASMGALRAAECCHFGMEGVGWIFDQYKSGERSADADVAVLHAPAELAYRPLTVALVDAEATIAQLSTLDLLGADEAASLRDAARQLHFKERTWQRMFSLARLAGLRRDAVSDAVRRHCVNQKALDAKDLILRIKAFDIDAPQRPHIAPENFNRTVYLDHLEKRLRLRPSVEREREC